VQEVEDEEELHDDDDEDEEDEDDEDDDMRMRRVAMLKVWMAWSFVVCPPYANANNNFA
jgi:hypothetical protein